MRTHLNSLANLELKNKLSFCMAFLSRINKEILNKHKSGWEKKLLSLFWSMWTDELPEGCCAEKLRALIYTFMIHIHKVINVDSLLLEICF